MLLYGVLYRGAFDGAVGVADVESEGSSIGPGSKCTKDCFVELFSAVWLADCMLVRFTDFVDSLVDGGCNGFTDQPSDDVSKSEGADAVVGFGKWDDSC